MVCVGRIGDGLEGTQRWVGHLGGSHSGPGMKW